jgi:acetyl esterase/lipase
VAGDFRELRAVLSLPGMESVRTRKDLVYRAVDGVDLRFDVYQPEREGPVPAVVFVHGDGPPEILADAKDWGQFDSWGRLAAVSGLAGVTFNHRSTEGGPRLREAASDVDALVAHVREHGAELGIDGERLGLWVCSMGPPVGLHTAFLQRPGYVRCIAVFYGVMTLRPIREVLLPEVTEEALAEFSPVELLGRGSGRLPPILVARAGLEERPWLNPTIDNFVSEVIAMNAELDVLTHPSGHHAFDVVDDDERSRDVIRLTLAFLQRHLLR